MRAFALLMFYFSIGIVVLNLSSCDEMDDIQKQFVDEEEQIYLGKVDSVEVIPGFGRALLKWEMSADPRVDWVKIYWNNRQDSVTRDFNRTSPGNIKDSIIIEDLAEGTYTFELRSENEMGELSLPTIVSGSVWGVNRGNELGSRNIAGFDYDHETSDYTLTFSPVAVTSLDERMVYSEITYTGTDGGNKILRVTSDTTQAILPDFESGSELTIRDVFVSVNVIDTIFNSPRVLTSQLVSQATPIGLGIPGQATSDFFTVGDSVLWEWKADGTVAIYSYENNVIQPQGVIPSDVFSRDSFNVLFHYGEVNLITVSHSGDVTMYTTADDTIATVLTPSGAEAMGTGFTSFSNYVPAPGYFYTVTSGTGELKVWLARDDATWGSPNGSTVATDFERFTELKSNAGGLLAIDEEGDLWQITTKINGAPDVYRKVGSGWDRFVKLIPVGSGLLALDQTGEFYFFQSMPSTEEYWVLD